MASGAVPSGGGPQIAVVVPSHNRPLRLRWLLNALEDQTLPRERWEVVVAHDSSTPETELLLNGHALAAEGALRHLTFAPGRASASKLRNAAWRSTSAPLVAFTDDDCRPPPEWLERALAAAWRHPEAIVQGATKPDPDERAVLRAAPHPRTQWIDPPVPWAQTCNIVYPRQVLERAGGFLEDPPLPVGEDTELAARARAAGTAYLGAPEVLTYHAVEANALPTRLRGIWRWRDLPLLVKRHPSVRGDFPLRVFWKWAHVWLPLAVAGGLLGRRRAVVLVLVLPWAWETRMRYTRGFRGRLRGLSQLPGRALIDAVEMSALACGSIEHRTFLL